MNVNYQNQRDISFRSIYNNKALKKGLEFAANNGTLFAATTTLALSGIRPLAILTTPKADKKNKQIACAKSLTSTANGYLIALACSLPISRAIKKIDKNPKKYLKPESIQNLKDFGKNLSESKAYTMATQLFKLGLGFVIAAPKAVLTAFGTPYILSLFDSKSSQNIDNKSPNITFQGKNKISKNIGKILDNKKLQDFVKKNKNSNFPLHIVAATDTLATATFIQQTNKSKKYKENEKKTLIYNSIISTALSIASTYLIDRLTKNKTEHFIKKYKAANKNDPNLLKQIEGIRIAKPILIAGSIYYIIIPILSTFLAERVENKKN